MKILFLTDFYPPHYIGGYELICQDQAVELAHRGHEVRVLTSQWRARANEGDGSILRLLAVIDPYGGSDHLEGRLLDPLRVRRRQRQLQLGIATRQNRVITRQVIQDYEPDLVSVWNMKSVGIGPVLAAQEAGIPTVFSLLDYWLADLKSALSSGSHPFKRWYNMLIHGLKNFDQLDVRYLIVISQAVKKAYIELGFPAEQLHTIHPGLPSDTIADEDDLPGPEASDAQCVRLLFVGRLVPEKGIEVALHALAYTKHLTSRRATLDVIGGGAETYRLHLQEMIVSLGLEDQVRLVGPLERQHVLEGYAAYDILLVPSLWVEPFGMIVIEAMARGLIVIAAGHGGPVEIISNGHDGRLVPPGDPVALAEAIVELANDPSMMDRMRIQAIQTVRGHYVLEGVVDQVEANFQAVVDGL